MVLLFTAELLDQLIAVVTLRLQHQQQVNNDPLEAAGESSMQASQKRTNRLALCVSMLASVGGFDIIILDLNCLIVIIIICIM